MFLTAERNLQNEFMSESQLYYEIKNVTGSDFWNGFKEYGISIKGEEGEENKIILMFM